MNRVVLFIALLLAPYIAYSQAEGFLPKGEFPKTDFANRSIELSSILSGGPPRDGIPAIDKPQFSAYADTKDWLGPNEPVVAFIDGQDARAYPLQVLIYHEIVNDTVNGKPVTVTFCPLCNASIVFDRTVDNQVLDFGTTGRLRKSDLIMYDRQSETWWQQFTGEGIIGKYNKTILTQLPSQIVSAATFAEQFPDGLFLNRNTGFTRPYGNNPYRGYDDINNSPFLYKGPKDNRLPPMERVLSINLDKSVPTTLVTLSTLAQQPLLSLKHNDQPVIIFATTQAQSALDKSAINASRQIPAAAAFLAKIDNNTIEFKQLDNGDITDIGTQSIWNAFGEAISGPLKGRSLQQIDGGVHFAFAWLAFEPESIIHE
jgi:hypothetical protein